MFARQNLQKLELAMGKSMQRISSGERLTTAGDDPHSVSILADAKAQLGGIRQAQATIQETLSMLQWMDGAMQTANDKILRIRDLAVTGANDATLTAAQQTALQTEVTGLITDLDSIGGLTWNNKALFNADELAGASVQVGPNAADTFTVTLEKLTSAAIGTAGTDLSAEDVSTVTNAQTAITDCNTAINSLSAERGNLGIYMKRLGMYLDQQMNAEVNVAATVSTVGDADLAQEISELAKNQILAQSATAIMGQANVQAQSLLRLLG